MYSVFWVTVHQHLNSTLLVVFRFNDLCRVHLTPDTVKLLHLWWTLHSFTASFLKKCRGGGGWGVAVKEICTAPHDMTMPTLGKSSRCLDRVEVTHTRQLQRFYHKSNPGRSPRVAFIDHEIFWKHFEKITEPKVFELCAIGYRYTFCWFFPTCVSVFLSVCLSYPHNKKYWPIYVQPSMKNSTRLCPV